MFSDGRLKNWFWFTRDSYEDMLLSFSYVIVSKKTYTQDEGTNSDLSALSALKKLFFLQFFSKVYLPCVDSRQLHEKTVFKPRQWLKN